MKVVDFINGLDLLRAKLPSKFLFFFFSSSFVIDVCSSCHELKMIRFTHHEAICDWVQKLLLVFISCPGK